MSTLDSQKQLVNTILTDDDYNTIITNNLQTTDFKLLKTKVSPLGEDLVGFMSTHLKIEVTVLLGTPSKEIKLNYFGKAKPSSQGAHVDLVDNTNLFFKESQFFRILYCDMKKHYEEGHGCDDGQSFCVCSCYFVRDDLIVLEDLSYKGFKLHENREILDFDHCAIVLQTLASFHAAYVSVEEKLKHSGKDPWKINELNPDMCSEALWLFDKNHPGEAMLRSSSNSMLRLTEYLPNYGKQSEYYEHIQEKLPETLKKICQLVQPSKNLRNVICHGDLWKNNIMFRYQHDKPVEVRFIDYQVIRYCPPSHDVMTFLYLTTSRKFRELHLMALLQIYYKSFVQELASFGLEPEEILPWTEFYESCLDSVSVGIMVASLYFQVIQLKPGVMKNVFSDSEKMKRFYLEDKGDILVPQYKHDPIFRERYSEIFEEFIEKCILVK